MSVVQRCLNCGTTQTTGGECKTCHEAQVQYFCTNHEPGIWLTAPTCPQCAARAAPPARPTVSTPVRPTRARPPAPRAVAVASKRPVDEVALDLRDSRPPLVVRGDAAVGDPAPEPAPEWETSRLVQAGGLLKRLAIRLVLIAVVLIAVLGVALYALVRSMP
ncbi:MAG: hypothetical protein WKG01_26935 [Kofleriaceae bacterium]